MYLNSVIYSLILMGWLSSISYADVKRIAILELKNLAQNNVSPTELHYLSNEVRLITSYLPKDQYLIMTKESMLTLIDPDKTLEDCVGECEIETGRLLNADWIITGELLRFGSSLRVSLRLHNTRNGQFVKGVSFKGRTIESLEKPLHIASLRLMYEIDPQLKKKALKHWGSDLSRHLKHIHNDLASLNDLPSDNTVLNERNTSNSESPLTRQKKLTDKKGSASTQNNNRQKVEKTSSEIADQHPSIELISFEPGLGMHLEEGLIFGADIGLGNVKVGGLDWTPIVGGIWSGDRISLISMMGTRIGLALPVTDHIELHTKVRFEYIYYDDFGCSKVGGGCWVGEYVYGFGGIYVSPEVGIRLRSKNFNFGIATRGIFYLSGDNNREYEPTMIALSIPLGWLY